MTSNKTKAFIALCISVVCLGLTSAHQHYIINRMWAAIQDKDKFYEMVMKSDSAFNSCNQKHIERLIDLTTTLINQDEVIAPIWQRQLHWGGNIDSMYSVGPKCN